MWSYLLGLMKKEIGSLRLSTCESVKSTPYHAAYFPLDLRKLTRSFWAFFGNIQLCLRPRTRPGTYAAWKSSVQTVPSGTGEHTSFRKTIDLSYIKSFNSLKRAPTVPHKGPRVNLATSFKGSLKNPLNNAVSHRLLSDRSASHRSVWHTAYSWQRFHSSFHQSRCGKGEKLISWVSHPAEILFLPHVVIFARRMDSRRQD